MSETARWSERQRRMLAEMGIRLWVPPSLPGEGAQAGADASSTAETTLNHRTTPTEPVGGGTVSSAASPARPVHSPIASREPSAALPRLSPSSDRVPHPAPAPTGAAVEGRRIEGVDRMGWKELREAVAGCEACTLCRSRRRTVFGVGHEQAHWMLVGEAPGEQEDLRGEPFVGKAGQLLDNMLAAIGLTRAEAPAEQQVFIANVLKCRPPRNRDPQPAEVAQCEPFLKRQLELVQPKLVLAMGRFAVQSLLQTDEPIGRLRGRVHQYHGVPLVVTYHPAYLLRNPTDKARAWEDLCLALEVRQGQG